MARTRYVWFLLAAAGCEDVSSADLLTSGIYADISAQADGTGTSVARVILKAGGDSSNTYVDLDGADRLTVSLGGGEPQPMVQESLGVIHHYVTTFSVAPTDADYVVALERTVDAGAPSSTVRLPPEFALDPPGVDSFSRLDDDLALGWSPASAEPMDIAINGSCIQAYAIDLPTENGSYLVTRGTLQPADTSVQESCDLTVTVTRHLAGSVDPAYGEGGVAEGRQVRSVNVTSSP